MDRACVNSDRMTGDRKTRNGEAPSPGLPRSMERERKTKFRRYQKSRVITPSDLSVKKSSLWYIVPDMISFVNRIFQKGID